MCLLCFGLFLREDTQAEVSVKVGVEGRGHDEVLARRQAESVTDFTQVDERLGTSSRRVCHEEVLVQVDFTLSTELSNEQIVRSVQFSSVQFNSTFLHGTTPQTTAWRTQFSPTLFHNRERACNDDETMTSEIQGSGVMKCAIQYIKHALIKLGLDVANTICQ